LPGGRWGDGGLRIADYPIRPIRPIQPISAIADCGLRIVEQEFSLKIDH
jgi:hypothetical protein